MGLITSDITSDTEILITDILDGVHINDLAVCEIHRFEIGITHEGHRTLELITEFVLESCEDGEFVLESCENGDEGDDNVDENNLF